MKLDRRRSQTTLIENIQSRIASYEIQQVIDLLTVLLEETKDQFLTCATHDFPRVQGEAQTYEKILRLLNRPPIKTLIPKE